mgnify:CR=1 FL=1
MGRYHPGVITLYFAAMLVFTAWFQQPVFLALSLFTALVVSKATLGGQWGRRLGWSLLLGAIIGIWWAVFARFGDTILIDNLLGNPLTLEGLVYSATLWVRVTAVVLWWESLLRLVPAERLLTLTGKVFPHLSLYGTVLLRFLPQFRRQRLCRHSLRMPSRRFNDVKNLAQTLFAVFHRSLLLYFFTK